MVFTDLMCLQVSGEAVNAYKEELPEYNDIFFHFMKTVFLSSQMIDMNILLKTEHWHLPDGSPGSCPADASIQFPGDKEKTYLLSGDMLAYFDFLMANVPWFNCVQVNAFNSTQDLAARYDRPPVAALLVQGMEDVWKRGSAQAGAAPRPKCRRLVMAEGD